MVEEPRQPPAPRRVLVVEDDEELREAVTRALTRAGFEVVVAATGAAALAAVRGLAPDAAVVDVFLPDAGGLGVARRLREAWGPVPVLFVTGLAIAAVREALAPAPVLFKPFTRKQLLASLRQIAA
jgi:DNA-binding response OmpR family regulator